MIISVKSLHFVLDYKLIMFSTNRLQIMVHGWRSESRLTPISVQFPDYWCCGLSFLLVLNSLLGLFCGFPLHKTQHFQILILSQQGLQVCQC